MECVTYKSYHNNVSYLRPFTVGSYASGDTPSRNLHQNVVQDSRLCIISISSSKTVFKPSAISSDVARPRSQGGTGDRYSEVPSMVQGRSPDEVSGRRPQKPDIYRQFAAVKCFSTQVCCRIRSPSLSPSKKLFGSAGIP